ncbi:hypothetical protein MCOR02_000969 [Pyricularia oryzae]|uniref:Secretory phospholipase A2 n=1 Tax=Pyricularia oryzae TaxID=318829 RepID=A0A4V1C8C0_PYROR|nr:hypothetical protein MCOR02_000969 [Pyricularia oryzae]KAI6327130.1 hypothetical protein MCOR34_000559 [Pyricularia oryzae]KAI6461817.1 hypothetical protein MCOR17_006159 [Pyricularia oryzae]KAI6468873.1 hypothetical protein MCOR15_001944 [Pyricularia oryzae]KAI6505092.1 hypothetical protein MCOR13_004423 [Pyricularia oryzae]
MNFLILLLAALVAATPMPKKLAKAEPKGAGLKASAADPKLIPVTDELVFKVPLETFIARRNKLDPAALDFSSDNCTKAPNNPLGFPFTPGCNRHDFGYQNFQAQGRFTAENKKKIDDNFQQDLKHQCSSVKTAAKPACNGLADVYHAAVRKFGGRKELQAKRDDSLEAEFQEKLAIYKVLEAEYMRMKARSA